MSELLQQEEYRRILGEVYPAREGEKWWKSNSRILMEKTVPQMASCMGPHRELNMLVRQGKIGLPLPSFEMLDSEVFLEIFQSIIHMKVDRKNRDIPLRR